MTGPRELAAYRAKRIDPATNAEKKGKRMTRTNATLEIPADDFAAANERLAKIGLAPTVETRDEQLAADIAEVVSEAQRPALAEQLAQTPVAPKQPRRINTAVNNLIAQRKKVLAVREGADAEIKMLDAALLALGWPES